MSDVLASFRELKGIGPATEVKLHEAGVYTWAALAQVVTALGSVRGSNGDTLHDLSAQIAGRASAAGGSSPPLPSGERSEAFIVRMSLAADGLPTRSTVTHVRTQTEQPRAGWSPDDVIRFIEAQASLAVTPQPGPAEHTPTPAPARAASPSRDHVVTLDVGNVIGGRRRSIELVVSTARVAPRADFEYRATLAGRPYGQAPATGPAWTDLAAHTGRSQPPERLPLRFDAVELPPGVQRLRLEMTLRLQAPTRRTPTLKLV
ncbi:MAG TPA: hypothetical protein VFH02_04355 [Jiangellaceae bacterium]|nr:hypothetical protein [Jiangellaceae bacterium]